ncbi:MAG TPA: branched-chain amino acid ABC transporter permease [Beijerinckiaceae bacterium]|nr:branched-chain amino acid ABC transporter permease [Beijerinckiaceae bacterium]
MQRFLSHRLTVVVVLALIVALLPLVFPSAYYYRVAGQVFVFGLAAIGLNLLMGYAGQVSLGHAGFMGIGAYAAAIGPAQTGTPVWFWVVAGSALSGLIAWVVGRPILKLRGHYLAVATLGFGILLFMVFTNESRWTGGPDGMPVQRLELFGWRVRTGIEWYWVSGVLLVLGAWVAGNLVDSPTGRAMRAIHDSEVASRSAGIDVARQKLTAFVISAVYASVAGASFALMNGHLTPDVSSFLRSVELVTMVVVGGMGSIFGSLVGSAVLVVLPQALTVFHDYEHAILGLMIMLFMIFLREGIVPSLARRFGRRSA